MKYTTKAIQTDSLISFFVLGVLFFGLPLIIHAQTGTELPPPAPAPTSPVPQVTNTSVLEIPPVLVPDNISPVVGNSPILGTLSIPTPDITPTPPTTPIPEQTPIVTTTSIEAPLPTITSTQTPPPATTTQNTTPTPIRIPKPATSDHPTSNQVPALSRAADNSALVRYLVVGSSHAEVALLQRFLNQKGYAVAQSGPGSSGNETSYFGNATKRALMNFQKANGITPTGTFGPITRGLVNKMMQ